MAISSKSLFLGVYYSNDLIRSTFLPLCYLLFFSPFALLFGRYYGVDKQVLQLIPEKYRGWDIPLEVFLNLVIISFITRVLTRGSSSPSGGGKQSPQLIPWWIIYFRHFFSVIIGGDAWFARERESSNTDIVAYNAAGPNHALVLSPSMLEQVVKSSNIEEASATKLATISNAIGLSSSSRKQYLQLQPHVTKTLQAALFRGNELENTIKESLRLLSESLPDLITFNSSVVDQLPWERVADIELTDGTDEVECDFFSLINEFLFNSIVSPLTGPQFTESYQLLATDLAALNEFYYALAVGFPRFFPLPGLPGASLARRRLLQNFTKFFDDLTHPPVRKVPEDDESQSGDEETDADSPTPITALNDLFKEHDVPMYARGAIALEVIQKIVSQAVPLAFWTLYHIYSSSDNSGKQPNKNSPLEKIRAETKDWARAVQPPSIHPLFPSPPQISFSSHAPLSSPTQLPCLRSAIHEAKRLYANSITTAKVTKSFTVTEKTIKPGETQEWELAEGTYVDIGLSQHLINTSPANHLDPKKYNPERFLNTQSPLPAPLAFDDSDEFVTSSLIALVAGITQLWEISAAPKKGFLEKMQEAQAAAAGQKQPTPAPGERKVGTWTMPGVVDGAYCKLPKGDMRVRIRKKEGLVRSK